MQDLKRALDWITAQKLPMQELLTKLAKINSGSSNLDGISEISKLIQRQFEQLDASIVTNQLPGYETIDEYGKRSKIPVGDLVMISKREQSDLQILLGGHLDTVFAPTDPFTRVDAQKGKLFGPGVADMKGGLVVMLTALQAFEKLSIAPNLGWEVFLNSDEEVGSLSSSKHLALLAKKHKLALLYEPSLNLNGDMSANRMGSGKFTITMRGTASHVGRAFNDGKNAIIKMAELSTIIHSWNETLENIIINAGKISGGRVVNQVPDTCVLKLDVRIKDTIDGDGFLSLLNAEMKTINNQNGYSVECFGGFTRPPKVVTEPAWEVYSQVEAIARQLGCPINFQDTGGCCDGNNLSQFGCVTLDTLGVLGEGIHSDNEMMLIDSLVFRAKLSLMIMHQYTIGEISL